MKKILAVILAALMLVGVPAVYAAELMDFPEQYCTVNHDFFLPTTVFYDYYYDCGDGTHKYVCGYNLYCGGCDEYIGWYDTYEDPVGSPHSYGDDGYCVCGRWDGITETNPPT